MEEITVSRKRHSPGPIPPSNSPRAGAAYQSPDRDEAEPGKEGEGSGEAFQEEAPKRRIGDFTGTGEHSRQQPGPLNNGGRMHGEDARE